MCQLSCSFSFSGVVGWLLSLKRITCSFSLYFFSLMNYLYYPNKFYCVINIPFFLVVHLKHIAHFYVSSKFHLANIEILVMIYHPFLSSDAFQTYCLVYAVFKVHLVKTGVLGVMLMIPRQRLHSRDKRI